MMNPVTALKIFMFLFAGGLVGVGYYVTGFASPDFLPLVVVLAGLGAVACVTLFVRPRP